MKIFRLHDKSSSWLDLRGHTLIAFSPVYEKNREGEINKGYIVSRLDWGCGGKPFVRHHLAYRFIYRFTMRDDELLLTPDTVSTVQENFEGIDDLCQYLADTKAALLELADRFEMALLEGEAFPEPEEITRWTEYGFTVTFSDGRTEEL